MSMAASMQNAGKGATLVEGAAAVDQVLRSFADRGAFRSFDASRGKGGTHVFRFGWLRDRVFTLVYDPRGSRMKMPGLFIAAPRNPPMAANLRSYLKTMAAEDRPPHRRVDPARMRVSVRSAANDIDLLAHVTEPDAGWAARKLISLVNEIYMMFLSDPLYYEYRVKIFNAHPDWG
ncbi:MAG: hypothetical protein QM696_03345 [Steroidobacteraceae bacterium]